MRLCFLLAMPVNIDEMASERHKEMSFREFLEAVSCAGFDVIGLEASS